MHRQTPISFAFVPAPTVAIGLVIVVALLVACTGGGDRPGVAPPAALASATPETAEEAGRPVTSREAVETLPVQATPVAIGRPLPLPFELALILATGNRLDRVVRTADGDTLQEVLFDPADHGGTVRITYWNIHHIGPVLPPGRLALAVCTAGDCGGHGYASADAAVSLFRSNDGGVTWKASAPLESAFLITTAADSDRLLLSRMTGEGHPYQWWPSGDVVTPPASWAGSRGPYVLPDGELLWWGGDGTLVDSQDATVIDLGEQLGPGQSASGIAVLPSVNGERIAITWKWSALDAPLDEQWLWSIYERVGDGGGYELTQTLDPPFAMIPTAWIDGSRLLVNGDFEPLVPSQPAVPGQRVRLPAILDLERTRLTPIAGAFGEQGIVRGWAVAVEIGPFARVVVGAGGCLNIRSGPSLRSERLDCAADGVLLRRTGAAQSGWLPVRTPAGDEGWASVEFLSVLPDQPVLAGK